MATSSVLLALYVSGAPGGVFRNESRIYDHVSDQAYKVIGPYALQPFAIDGDLQVDLRSQHLNRHTVGDD
jgi:hypothetical protein